MFLQGGPLRIATNMELWGSYYKKGYNPNYILIWPFIGVVITLFITGRRHLVFRNIMFMFQRFDTLTCSNFTKKNIECFKAWLVSPFFSCEECVDADISFFISLDCLHPWKLTAGSPKNHRKNLHGLGHQHTTGFCPKKWCLWNYIYFPYRVSGPLTFSGAKVPNVSFREECFHLQAATAAREEWKEKMEAFKSAGGVVPKQCSSRNTRTLERYLIDLILLAFGSWEWFFCISKCMIDKK